MSTNRSNNKREERQPTATYLFEGERRTAKQIAELTGLHRTTVLRVLYSLDYPDELRREQLPQSKFANQHRYKDLTYNKSPMTLGKLEMITGKSSTFLRGRIKEYGLALTSEHLKPKRQQAKKEFIGTTPEERAKLAKIPGPTKYELELFGDSK
jgi:hypothetical protein